MITISEGAREAITWLERMKEAQSAAVQRLSKARAMAEQLANAPTVTNGEMVALLMEIEAAQSALGR